MKYHNSYLSIHQYRLDLILKSFLSLNLPIGSTILDLGCYPDYLLQKLRHKGYKVIGICSPHEIINDVDVYTVNLEKQNLPQKNSSVDLIIFTEVLEHLVNPTQAIKEISRILKPKGLLILTTPNAVRLQNLIRLLFHKNITFDLETTLTTSHELNNINHRHNREYTQTELKTLLQKYGLEIQTSYCFTAYTPFRQRQTSSGKKILAWLNYLFCLILPNRADSVFILAQKG